MNKNNKENPNGKFCNFSKGTHPFIALQKSMYQPNSNTFLFTFLGGNGIYK